MRSSQKLQRKTIESEGTEPSAKKKKVETFPFHIFCSPKDSTEMVEINLLVMLHAQKGVSYKLFVL